MKITDNKQRERKFMINQLIEGARFSTRAAEEQQLRELRRADAVHLPQGITDVRRVEALWDQAAQCLCTHDLGGSDLAWLTRRTV